MNAKFRNKLKRREIKKETLSCWGEEDRPRPWVPTSASMSEFSDSVIDT